MFLNLWNYITYPHITLVVFITLAHALQWAKKYPYLLGACAPSYGGTK